MENRLNSIEHGKKSGEYFSSFRKTFLREFSQTFSLFQSTKNNLLNKNTRSFSFDVQKAKYIKKVIYIIPPLLSSEFLQISQVLLQKYFM